MTKLPPMNAEGKRRIREMLKRRDSEEKLLNVLLADTKSEMTSAIKQGGRVADKSADPVAKIALVRAQQGLVFADWIALYVQSTVLRMYDYEHILTHLLYSTEQPVRGKQLRELQALLGDHGVRLLAMEEDLEHYQKKMGGTIGELYNKLTFKDKLEEDSRKG